MFIARYLHHSSSVGQARQPDCYMNSRVRGETTDMQDSVRELIGVFLSEAKGRLTEIDSSLGALTANRDDAEALERLFIRFHGFAGIGGFEGMDTINHLAARCEGECQRLRPNHESPTPEQV